MSVTVNRRRAIAGMLAAGSAAITRPADAVIILDGTWRAEGGRPGREAAGFRAHEALAKQPQFAGVIPLSTDGGEDWGVASGTWLGNFGGNAWVLSAAHVFERDDSVHDFVFRAPDGTVCEGTHLVRHPLFNGDNDVSTGYDVAMVRIKGPMHGGGQPPLLYGGDRELGMRAVMVGYGARGIGSVGQKPVYDGDSGAKAAATNTIDEVMAMVLPPPKDEDRGNWLSVTFRRDSEGAGRLDGILGSGDSGGSLWIQTATGWTIAGVNANATGETYGARAYFARVSGLRRWLSSILPGLRFIA
jgi:hypothetical protein